MMEIVVIDIISNLALNTHDIRSTSVCYATITGPICIKYSSNIECEQPKMGTF